MTEQLLLFPLQTVLFPGGRRPLKIFETRYLDLVSHCLHEAELHDPGWLSFRRAELLPDLVLKPTLLQMESWRERLAHLRTLLSATATAV